MLERNLNNMIEMNIKEEVIILRNKHRQRRNNKLRRKNDKAAKETKMFNTIVSSEYNCGSKRIGNRSKDDPYKIGVISSILGTGFFIKSCRTNRKAQYKKVSKKKVRQILLHNINIDGNYYQKIFDLAWTIS